MLVLKDTREQKGWNFLDFDEVEVQSATLQTGDYTLQGCENTLIIERKGSVSELAHNIFTDSFKRELERMATYDHPFLILEFSLHDVEIYPNNKNIPPRVRRKIRVSGSYILSCLSHFMLVYGIHVVPCGNAIMAEKFVMKIFKKFGDLGGIGKASL